MTSEEFLRRYAPSPKRIRTNHDDINNVELDRLESRFSPSTSVPLTDPALTNVAQAGGRILVR